jgi:hypothetical protein
MTIAVYARSTKDNLPIYIEQLYTLFKKDKVELVIFKEYYEFLKKNYDLRLDLRSFSTSDELISMAD